MEFIQIIISTSIIVGGILLVGYLNKRFDLGLDDISSEMFGGLGCNTQIKRLAEKDKLIKSLTERVEVLEKLITDPQEQLKREINCL
jgi:hypothetical protein